MKQTPLISIIVPVYNVEKYIGECVKSILEQTFNEIEIILVDDGSTDSSGEKCEEFAIADRRVIVHHKDNEGLGYARNTGLDLASGKYIVFIDGDDFIGKDYIEQLYKNIQRTNADVCIGGYTRFDSTGVTLVCSNPLSGDIYQGIEIREKVIPRLLGQIVRNDNIAMSACMTIYNRKIIEDNKIRFPSERELISEDLVFNFEVLSKSSSVAMVESTDYFYRYNPTSLTHRYLPGRFLKQKRLYMVMEEKAKALHIYDLCHQRNMDTFIGWARGHIKAEQAAWKRNGIVKSIRNIRVICRDTELQEALREYDDRYLSRSSKIVNRMIKRKMPVSLWLISAIQYTIKRGM